jgi:hypothetical protein
VEDEFGFFCCEKENIHHLFLNCCVAVNVCNMVSQIVGLDVGADFESIVQLWLSQNVMEVLIHPSYGPVAATAQPSYWLQCPYAIASCHSKREDVHVRR